MFQNLLNLFFPKICLGCETFLLQNEIVICTVCRHEIPLTNHDKLINNENFNRFYGRVTIQSATAFFYYNKKGITQNLIHNLKFKGHQEIGTLFGNWFSESLKSTNVIKDIDEIIPVPLHKKRFKERGYNQIETFGLALSENLNVNYNSMLLFRVVYADKQSKKNLLDRNDNLSSVFDIVFSDKDHNKHFLLVDDVVTTGATLEMCVRALLKIPGSKVSIATIALTQS